MNILLIGKDLDYCRAFSKSVSRISREVSITLVDGNDAECLEKQAYDLILWEGLERTKEEKADAFHINLVKHKDNLLWDLENHQYQVCKFDNIKSILKSLHMIYCMKSGEVAPAFDNGKSQLICVFSQKGGMGKTAVSLGLAQEFAQFREKKVLYLNYEEWNTTTDYFPFQDVPFMNNLDYYLYCLQRKKPYHAEAFLSQFLKDLYSFHPSGGRNQLRLLNSEELNQFLSKTMETLPMDYIFVDCPNSLDEAMLWMLKNADGLVYITETDMQNDMDIRENRGEKIISYIEEKTNRVIGEKLIRVLNQYKMDEVDDFDEHITIPWDPGSFSAEDGKCKIRSDLSFGMGIGKLADAIERLL